VSSSITGWEWLGTLAIFAIFWLVPSFFVGKAAEKKKRSFWAFFFISVFFSWILAGIIVAIMRKEN
jgi:Na+/proline symporter